MRFLSRVTTERYWRRRRLTIVGLGAFLLSFVRPLGVDALAGDFTWLWHGARDLIAGVNPYHDPLLARSNPCPFNDPRLYPLPSVLVAFELADPPSAGSHR